MAAEGLRRRRRNGQAARRRIRERGSSDERAAEPGPERGLGWLPAHRTPDLSDRLHQAAAVYDRRRAVRQGAAGRTGQRAAPAWQAVGHNERDRQLTGPGLAVAARLLVSDRTVQ